MSWQREVGSTGFDSQNPRGLQVAEFVAGAIGGGYDHGDSTYCDIIATTIAIEKKFS